jgi:hypothetical protein
MPLSMYQASVPTLIRNLNNLSAILTKGEAFATAKKIDASVFMNERLAIDMFALPRQIQIATDVSKGGAARLAGIDIPSFEDNESNFAELQARIAKTIAFLKTIKPEQIDGSEERTINLKVGGNDMTMTGQAYLFGFVLPNVFFHATTTYSILRHNGVELGKKDFLGGV